MRIPPFVLHTYTRSPDVAPVLPPLNEPTFSATQTPGKVARFNWLNMVM